MATFLENSELWRWVGWSCGNCFSIRAHVGFIIPWRVQYQLYAIPSKDNGNYFRMRASFSTISSDWRFQSPCMLQEVDLPLMYHKLWEEIPLREGCNAHLFGVQIHWPQMWDEGGWRSNHLCYPYEVVGTTTWSLCYFIFISNPLVEVDGLRRMNVR